jgi:hypothetical protein
MKILIALFALWASFSIARADSETVKGAQKDFETFKQEMSAKLDDVDRQLAEMRAKAKAKGGDVQDKSIKELEVARVQAKAQMDAINDDTKSNWKSMKKKLAASIDSLHAKAKKALAD